jgi:low affinity Fe/Cu permease
MKKTYIIIERIFEKLTNTATKILGNSITFILALCLVLFWWTIGLFISNDWHQNIGDFIFGTTFLSLFIIQKSFNRYSALIHLKINELISSHETANNAVMDDSEKTEHEIRKLSKEYLETEEILQEEINQEGNPDTDSQNKG